MIKIFTGKGCEACAMLKSFLNNEGIGYEEVDVHDDPGVAQQVAEQTGYVAVPIICNPEGECVVGFDKEGIKELLKN